MRPLTPKEQRTVRFGAAAIAIYLAVFYGPGFFKRVAAQRADYRLLVTEASDMRERIRPYQDKTDVSRKLMESFHMDPMTLTSATLVAGASAAIQKASSDSGVEAGAIRESSAHGSAREAASIQYEGSGSVSSILSLLQRLQSTGYPLIVDSVQISPDNRRPGSVKLRLTIVVLDFDKWKTEEAPNA